MAGMQSEIEINRPVEAVYGFVLDLEESITRTDPTVESVVKPTQGPLAAGTTFRIGMTDRKAMAVARGCSVLSCGEPHRAKGLCKLHYDRARYWGGNPLAGRSWGQTCSVEGCERKAHARGWCDTHYQRWRSRGEVG